MRQVDPICSSTTGTGVLPQARRRQSPPPWGDPTDAARRGSGRGRARRAAPGSSRRPARRVRVVRRGARPIPGAPSPRGTTAARWTRRASRTPGRRPGAGADRNAPAPSVPRGNQKTTPPPPVHVALGPGIPEQTVRRHGAGLRPCTSNRSSARRCRVRPAARRPIRSCRSWWLSSRSTRRTRRRRGRAARSRSAGERFGTCQVGEGRRLEKNFRCRFQSWYSSQESSNRTPRIITLLTGCKKTRENSDGGRLPDCILRGRGKTRRGAARSGIPSAPRSPRASASSPRAAA